MTTLLIVESPGKIKKLQSILGNSYKIMASMGHISDLDPDSLSIDILGEPPNYRFLPKYKIKSDRRKVVVNLKAAAKKCKEIILAGDADREGCRICEALADVLKIKSPKRIIFQEITKTAIHSALQSPTGIDQNLLNSQKGRRVLDRLVGYKISPVLGAKKSAGRVQSAVLHLIEIRNREAEAALNNIQMMTKITGDFGCFDATLYSQHVFTQIAETSLTYTVLSNSRTESLKNPSPPYTTSSLQQDATQKLFKNAQQIMSIAQTLYEKGLITYHRTDSCFLSTEAQQSVGDFVRDNFGPSYHAARSWETKMQPNAQEAHEAIRVTNVSLTDPEDLDPDSSNLYNLIWKRTVASQMAAACYNISTLLLRNTEGVEFQAIRKTLCFDGFLRVTSNSEMVTDISFEAEEGDLANLMVLYETEHVDDTVLNYKESSLIHKMEVIGIGRPATYAQIVQVLLKKGYVEMRDVEGVATQLRTRSLRLDTGQCHTSTREAYVGSSKKRFLVTSLGHEVLELLRQHFPMIVDVTYTAQMEHALDRVAFGEADWQTVCSDFYQAFAPTVERLQRTVPAPSNSENETFLGTGPSGHHYSIYKGKYGLSIKCVHPPMKTGAPPLFFFTKVNKAPASLAEAVEASKDHRLLGVFRKKPVWVVKNEGGLYLRHGSDKRVAIKASSLHEVQFEACKKLL